MDGEVLENREDSLKRCIAWDGVGIQGQACGESMGNIIWHMI